MKRLTLLRHAKSSWQDHDASDHDRVLNQRGIKDAPRMAQRIATLAPLPDLILCSSAQRTRETCNIMINEWGIQQDNVEIVDALYLASTGTLQSAIENTADNIEHLMLIAHNPGLEQLGMLLHPDAPKRMPTCAVLHFQLDQADFSLDTPASIILQQYDYPKNPDGS